MPEHAVADRDQLAELLLNTYRRLTPEDHAWRALASAILAAGWRPPSEPLGYLGGLQHQGQWQTSDAGGCLYSDRSLAQQQIDRLNDFGEPDDEPRWELLEARRAHDV